MYMAVASPSRVGLVAIINSLTSSWVNRLNNSFSLSWSGPTPFKGDITPCSTWYRPRKARGALQSQYVHRVLYDAYLLLIPLRFAADSTG